MGVPLGGVFVLLLLAVPERVEGDVGFGLGGGRPRLPPAPVAGESGEAREAEAPLGTGRRGREDGGALGERGGRDALHEEAAGGLGVDAATLGLAGAGGVGQVGGRGGGGVGLPAAAAHDVDDLLGAGLGAGSRPAAGVPAPQALHFVVVVCQCNSSCNHPLPLHNVIQCKSWPGIASAAW